MKLTANDIRRKLEAGRDYKAPDFAKLILNNHLETDLLKLAIDKDSILSNRAMWILWHCSVIDYKRVEPFLNKLITHLNNKAIPSGVVRCFLALFQENPVPEKHHSFILDKCYSYITNSTEAIAVRAFAMTVAFNVSKNYTELLQELEATLLHLSVEEESAAIRARTKNTLKSINQFKKKSKGNS